MTMLSATDAASVLARIATDAPMSGKARIPIGTPVFQDHCSLTWPDVSQKGADPYTEFDISVRGGVVTCCAHGFGILGGPSRSYGNGAILIGLDHWRAAHGAPHGAPAKERP